ncbi:MAG: YicC family protein [Candidatus Eisenbacteria bacterium]|nr:YicC family protein [Candidatus Latescibacterota bacterium]MBD3302829.1 YicC family protein [Candidatus Eisenbacteria bacterium]
MLLSMTGYGRAEARGESRTLTVEIRSVNHRFGEISIRLPKSLAVLENRVRERIQKEISRGKITCGVVLDGESEELGNLRIDESLASRYVTLFRELKEKLGLPGEIELATLVGLPDVLTWERDELDEESGWRLLEPPLRSALDDLMQMKRREGEILARDLGERIRGIESSVVRIEERVPQVIDAVRRRLRDRLEELLEDQEAEYSRLRLEAEIALFADRSDCTEECVRLRAHCQQFAELIRAGKPVGRKLNFLLQEMNREANTIGSKSLDVDIAREVIGIKEEGERLREQVANIE